MSEYAQELKELETEVMRLMKNASKTGRNQSVLWGQALKLVQAAKKSGAIKDLVAAYDMVLSLGYTPDMRRADEIVIVLDALAWYSLRYLPMDNKTESETLTYLLVPVEIDDPMLQHYIRHWRLQACYKAAPDSDAFWQAWYHVFELTVRYRASMQEGIIRRLFAAYGRDLKVRKIS